MENISNIGNLKFKEGNKRSLAMALKPVLLANGFDNPEQTSWEVARAMTDGFKKKDVEAYLQSLKSNERENGVTANGVNASARILLGQGMTVSQIAFKLGKSYQRVKNIEKRMKKKGAISE